MSNKQDQQLKKEKENSIPQNQSKLALDLLKIIAVSGIRLGDRDKETEHIRHKEITMKVIQLLHKQNVELIEVDILFRLMQQAVVVIESTVQGSLEFSKDLALKNFWGKHPDEITLKDVDDKMGKKFDEKEDVEKSISKDIKADK